MKYPKNIQQGGTIGFVAPSFGCQIEPYYSAFGNAQKKFREMGYQLQLGPNCYAGDGIGISNTPEKCGHVADILSNESMLLFVTLKQFLNCLTETPRSKLRCILSL